MELSLVYINYRYSLEALFAEVDCTFWAKLKFSLNKSNKSWDFNLKKVYFAENIKFMSKIKRSLLVQWSWTAVAFQIKDKIFSNFLLAIKPIENALLYGIKLITCMRKK